MPALDCSTALPSQLADYALSGKQSLTDLTLLRARTVPEVGQYEEIDMSGVARNLCGGSGTGRVPDRRSRPSV